ncbi:MAG: cytochrome c oxidase assembly protein [Alphaproteobacteria bacterium]|nr:cytochrome c oxidase assembly protein [Alphaproteobacteria bacterium]
MRRAKTLTVALSLVAVVAMGGLVAASVPLYRLFCEVTGLGGTTRQAEAGAPAPPSDAMVTVRFDANVNSKLPWRFQPDQPQMRVRLGETVLASYTAENLSAEPITGTATYNVTPAKAGQFFNKVECFCFTEQHLAPGQTVHMPVAFWVDPALVVDPDTNEVGTITLSYTFFRGSP